MTTSIIFQRSIQDAGATGLPLFSSVTITFHIIIPNSLLSPYYGEGLLLHACREDAIPLHGKGYLWSVLPVSGLVLPYCLYLYIQIKVCTVYIYYRILIRSPHTGTHLTRISSRFSILVALLLPGRIKGLCRAFVFFPSVNNLFCTRIQDFVYIMPMSTLVCYS